MSRRDRAQAQRAMCVMSPDRSGCDDRDDEGARRCDAVRGLQRLRGRQGMAPLMRVAVVVPGRPLSADLEVTASMGGAATACDDLPNDDANTTTTTLQQARMRQAYARAVLRRAPTCRVATPQGAAYRADREGRDVRAPRDSRSRSLAMRDLRRPDRPTLAPPAPDGRIHRSRHPAVARWPAHASERESVAPVVQPQTRGSVGMRGRLEITRSSRPYAPKTRAPVKRVSIPRSQPDFGPN
jgi:hypothetical protein